MIDDIDLPVLPAELLPWFARHGLTAYIAGGMRLPHVIVAARSAGGYIDLAHVRGPDRTEAARVPADENASIWFPQHVVWHYYGTLAIVLRQLICLLPAQHEAAPRQPYPPPRNGLISALHVTPAEREIVNIRPPRGSHDLPSGLGEST